MSNVSFRLATPSSNLSVQKAQYNMPSKLFEAYNKTRSIKERGRKPGLLGSTPRFCPCPGFQAWALLSRLPLSYVKKPWSTFTLSFQDNS